MNGSLIKQGTLKLVLPSTASILSKLLGQLALPRLSTTIYSTAKQLNQILLTTKEPLLIIIQDLSLLTAKQVTNRFHSFILLGNKTLTKDIDSLIFTAETEKQILSYIIKGVKTKETQVQLDNALDSQIKEKVKDVCKQLGVSYKQKSRIHQGKGDYEVIIVAGEKIKIQKDQKLLIVKKTENVQKQLIKMVFHEEPIESSLTLLYEGSNPSLEKQLVTLSAKCNRPNIIKLFPFFSVHEFQKLKRQSVINNPVIIITCSKQLYNSLDKCDLLHAQKYLLSNQPFQNILTITMQQLSEEVMKYLSLSQIISTELVLGHSSLKQVKIVDGIGLRVVQQLCQELGIGYEYAKKSWKQLSLNNTFHQINSNDLLEILLMTESTYSSRELKQFKPFIDSDKILTILIKSNQFPIPLSISQYISHTCEQSAIVPYLSTLVHKYSQIEPLFKYETTVLMNKNKGQKQIQKSQVHENDTSIQHFLPHFSNIQVPTKSVVLQHIDIPSQHVSDCSTIYSFKEWQDLVKLSERYKDNIRQIRVITGVWYENMLGSFRTNILKFAPQSTIKQSILNLSKYQQTHIYYGQELQYSILQHIFHVCELKPNLIPHKIESPIEIQHSILNNLNYTFALTTSPVFINYLRSYPEKGTNYHICNAPHQMHKTLFNIINSDYSPILNVHFQLAELEYRRILRSVSEATLNSELLSSINLSRSSAYSTNDKDIIDKIDELRKEEVLYILAPNSLLKALTQHLAHLKGVHLKGYNEDLMKQLKQRRSAKLRSLVIFQQNRGIEKSIIEYSENFYIGQQKHFPSQLRGSKFQLLPCFLVKTKEKLFSLIELSSKKKAEEWSLNISRSSVNTQPIILFYKYPQEYSLKQQISTHCNRTIDLRAYSNPESLLLSLKSVQNESLSFQSTFIIVVLKDDDINEIEPQLQMYHKVIRLFTPSYIESGKMATNSNTLMETTKYVSIINYLKGDYIEEEIDRNGFIQQKTLKVGLDSSQSSESAITLGRHSIHEDRE